MPSRSESAIEPVATLRIRRAAAMTPEGRRRLAEWLRRQARALAARGETYAKSFQAVYLAIRDGSGGDV